MQQLVCDQCSREWQRPPKRGRKPSLCSTCQDGGKSPQSEPEAPQKPRQATKPKRRHKSKWVKLQEDKKPLPKLTDRPFTQRPTGWCTDYDPMPAAQHDKCDGDIGKYRCPCECHGWSDNE